MGLYEFLRKLFPLWGEQQSIYEQTAPYLTEQQASQFKDYLKLGNVSVTDDAFGIDLVRETYPKIVAETEEAAPFCDTVNERIQRTIKERVFKAFSNHAEDEIREMIAPNIVGMHAVKESVLLQLFSEDRVHVLLLGDPGTGKTDILRAAADLAPKSSFGLGSGTSGAGLTVTVKGKEVVEGLLPMADGGLCCIDELNLLKDRDRAGLLNAMEKGFVSYDKGNKHIQVEADVKILGTANPKGDQFKGWDVESLKKQVPFDPALLTRFHLVFLIRRPDTEEFKEISKKIVSGDRREVTEAEQEFVKDYIEYANSLNVTFDDELEPMVTGFVEEIKQEEEKYLMDVSPRLVVGAMRLAKASARLNLRRKTSRKDLRRVLDLMKESLVANVEEKRVEE
jgi:DNA replicative helicase MCM subunit Mcm2 (Cdc46/Mcm family)